MMNEKDFEKVCADCAEYIRFIYSKIVFCPNELEVHYKVSEFVHFVIEGNERDDGVIIGRQGATIQSLRLFVHAYSKTNMDGRPCIVEVKDHQGSKYNPLTTKGIYSRRPRNHTKR